jgi:RNA polymerase sigma-70 factor (ECF subfamily)
VHGVARNVVAEHHRRRAREHARLARLAGEPLDPSDAEDPVAERLAAAIELFLPALSPPYRQALEEVDLKGRSQAEVARELGLPLSTLRTRVQRGRAELRRLFELCCEIETDARGKPTSCEPRQHGCESC